MSAFYEHNRKKFIERMDDRSVAILFSGEAPWKSADARYEYTPNKHFYYLTGIDRPNMALLITKWGTDVQEHLYIEFADPTLEKWEGKRLTKEQATEISGLKKVHYIEHLDGTFANLMARNFFENIYLDLERRQLEGEYTKGQSFGRLVQEKYPSLTMQNAHPIISELRMYKEPHEIEQLKQAIAITNKGIQAMMSNARPGMKEYELEAHYDYVLKSHGVRERAFETIIAGGQRATVLHYVENDAVVEDNSLVLIDLGAKYGHYSADISRTFPINGTFTERQKDLYNLVLKAELETIAAIKPGVAFTTLNEITKRVLTEGARELGLLKEGEDISKYYYHGVSHFLGLDTHDVGNYRDLVLQPGMVLTVEPGLYVEGEGIGIRIEDDVLVTEEGHEVLSPEILKTVEDIEAFMKK